MTQYTIPIFIPLFGGGSATLQATFPMTEQNWNHMMAVLEVMKPGLVAQKNQVEGNE